MISLRFCPRCGNAVEPDKRFCTNCGASLRPDLPGPGARDLQPAAPGPLASGPVAAGTGRSGIPARSVLAAVAGLVAIILIIVFIGFPLATGQGIFSPAGTPSSPAPALPAASGTGDLPTGSYVIVETEEPTPLPTTETPVTATATLPATFFTTATTTVQITKSVICASDRLACNNTCVDPRTDNSHCGTCNTSCPAGTSCQNGNCARTCTAGQASCADGCFNLLTDPRHCGSCQNSCPVGLICYMGRCDSPATPMPVPQ